jgi:hypothetical protein
MAVTRLSGGLTPANGSDPRTFPAIWNATADDIEQAETDIATLQGDVSAIEAWDLDDINDVVITSATTGEVLKYDGTNWINGTDASGKILQVVQASKTDAFTASVASGANTEVTGLSATITPSSATSKILIQYAISGTSQQLDGFSTILRQTIGGSGASIGIGDAASNRTRVTHGGSGNPVGTGMYVASGLFLDSPATTSAITYTVNIHNSSTGSATLYVNRSVDDADAARSTRGGSRILVMEVAG